MAAVPAACLKCGAIFWMHLPFEGIGTWRLESNFTDCPVPGCGGVARLADGVFQFARDGLAVVSAPGITYDMLAALQAVLRRAHEQDLPVEEIKRQAEEVSPAFGGLFDAATWSSDVKSALIMLLAAIIAAIIALRQEEVTVNVNSVDPARLIDAIREMPADRVVQGGADERISEAIKPQIIGPPKLKPDDATRPEQGPKKGKQP